MPPIQIVWVANDNLHCVAMTFGCRLCGILVDGKHFFVRVLLSEQNRLAARATGLIPENEHSESTISAAAMRMPHAARTRSTYSARSHFPVTIHTACDAVETHAIALAPA